MTDVCRCPPEAGAAVCALPGSQTQGHPAHVSACPTCKQAGKTVQVQTVKALLAVSLRDIRSAGYLFCRTHSCPVVYFASDGTHAFTTTQIRERVYQKEPEASDVPVCYCFRHTTGAVCEAGEADRAAIVADITAGIQAGQCACEVRNPQGSCCLGNVRRLIKHPEPMVTR